jgi:hypothetical protein
MRVRPSEPHHRYTLLWRKCTLAGSILSRPLRILVLAFLLLAAPAIREGRVLLVVRHDDRDGPGTQPAFPVVRGELDPVLAAVAGPAPLRP